MTKTVFANGQLAHVWAQQNQPEGRSNNGNFYFRGPDLYSYGRHFCVARFVSNARGERAVILNSDSYSVSTRGHQGYASSAVRGLGLPLFHTPGAESDGRAALAHYSDTAAAFALKAKRARDPFRKSYNAEQAVRTLEEAQAFAAFFDQSWSALDLETLRAELEASQAAYRAERAAREAAQRERDKEDFEAWRRGENTSCPWSYAERPDGGVYLRICGDELQTSRHASVPLSHAIKAFRFVKLVRERGEGWKANGRTVRVGHFTVDEITAKGDMRAGCHRLTWPEIERAAQLAGVLNEAPADTSEPRHAAYAQ